MIGFRFSKFVPQTIIALVFVVAASISQASSVTYTATVPTQLTDLTNAALIPALPMYRFGNTLTGVSITIQGAGTVTFNSITNNGASSGTVIATQGTSLWLDDLNSASIDSLLGPLQANIAGSTPGVVGAHNVINGGTVIAAHSTVGPLGPYTMGGSLASESFSSPADLALFQGSVGGNDLLDFVMSTYSDTVFTTNGSNNFDAVYSEIAGATVTITYDYTGTAFTPEPGTLTMFGTGLLGLAGLLRFKFRKSN